MRRRQGGSVRLSSARKGDLDMIDEWHRCRILDSGKFFKVKNFFWRKEKNNSR